ncbi:MAG: OB-fold nucleic acid binding domain-containing protein [Promethearchaeota archaeon]
MSFSGNPNNSANSTRMHRLPACRVFIEDLQEGVWNEDEKIFSTRYGTLKRVRICGTILRKNAEEKEPSEESIISEQSNSDTRISFLIDDGTGRLWATLWGASPEDYDLLEKGSLVDLVGFAREYREKPSISLEFIRPLENPNYEVYHSLDILRKRKLEPSFTIDKSKEKIFDGFDFDATSGSGSGTDVESSQDNFYDPAKPPVPSQEQLEKVRESSKKVSNKSQSANFTSNSRPGHSNSAFNQLDIEDKILTFLQDKDEGDGVSVKDLLSNLGVSKEDLKQILDQMVQDVKIYRPQAGHYSCY